MPRERPCLKIPVCGCGCMCMCGVCVVFVCVCDGKKTLLHAIHCNSICVCVCVLEHFSSVCVHVCAFTRRKLHMWCVFQLDLWGSWRGGGEVGTGMRLPWSESHIPGSGTDRRETAFSCDHTRHSVSPETHKILHIVSTTATSM